MKQEMLDKLIGEFLSSTISPTEKKKLKIRIIKTGYDLDELEKIDSLYSDLDLTKVPEVSNKLDESFYQSLETFKKTHNYHSPWRSFSKRLKTIMAPKYITRFAYSLLLLIIGWYFGGLSTQNDLKNVQLQSMSKEIGQMKHLVMNTMLEQSSATKRIKAISYANDFKNADDQILDTLLDTLNNDSNSNVRLAALEALTKYSNLQPVREGLIQSISTQKSPLVQIALIDLMLKLREKSSIKELNLLLTQKNLNYSVRQKTKKIIQQL